jgi:hypothetical protein
MGSVALMAMVSYFTSKIFDAEAVAQLTIQSAWPFYNGAYIVFARRKSTTRVEEKNTDTSWNSVYELPTSHVGFSYTS